MSHTQTRISTGDDGPDMIEASFYLRKVYVKIFDVRIILITTLFAVWSRPYHLTRFSMQCILPFPGIKQQLVCVGPQVVACKLALYWTHANFTQILLVCSNLTATFLFLKSELLFAGSKGGCGNCKCKSTSQDI